MAHESRSKAHLLPYGKLPYAKNMRLEPQSARLEARLPNEVLTRLKRAAEIQGRTLTDFVVAAADEAACRAIEQSEILRLSLEDQRQIAQAILNPPEPVPALRKAFRQHRKLFGAQ
jgi:uncharacterized protein (DUF1778 family)